MVIFHCYVKLPEGILIWCLPDPFGSQLQHAVRRLGSCGVISRRQTLLPWSDGSSRALHLLWWSHHSFGSQDCGHLGPNYFIIFHMLFVSISFFPFSNVDVLFINPPPPPQTLYKSIWMKFRPNNGRGSLANFPDLCGAEQIACKRSLLLKGLGASRLPPLRDRFWAFFRKGLEGNWPFWALLPFFQIHSFSEKVKLFQFPAQRVLRVSERVAHHKPGA